MSEVQKRFIILFTILIVSALTLGCVDQTKIQEQKPKIPFDILPHGTSVPENVPAIFTVTINAPYGFNPTFKISPVRPDDAMVLKIDDSQLTQIGYMYINNSISKEISISGRVVYGNSASYPIKVILLVNNETEDEKQIYLNVTR